MYIPHSATIKQKLLLSLTLLLLLPLPTVEAKVILSNKYSSNLPMQRSIFNVHSALWIFSLDTSTSHITLQIITDLNKYRHTLTSWHAVPHYIANSSVPYNFDVCYDWRGSFHIVHVTSTQSLEYIKITTAKNKTTNKITFSVVEKKTLTHSGSNVSPSHPSIDQDGYRDLHVTYFDINDGHLYLISRINTEPQTTRISQEPAPLYVSRVQWLPYGDMMILFSNNNKTLLYAVYDTSSSVSEPQIITSHLSSQHVWCVAKLVGYDDVGGAMLVYHTDSHITMRRYTHKGSFWSSEIKILRITGTIYPLITSLGDGKTFSILWCNPYEKKFYFVIGQEDSPWYVEKPIKDSGTVTSGFMSVYHKEVLGYIGLIYSSEKGLNFIFLCEGSPNTERENTSFVSKVIKGFVGLTFLVYVLKKVLLTEGG